MLPAPTMFQCGDAALVGVESGRFGAHASIDPAHELLKAGHLAVQFVEVLDELDDRGAVLLYSWSGVGRVRMIMV